MSQISAEVEKKLVNAVERMPAFPKSVQKVLELTRNINCLPKELVGVIEKDPVMTVKILRLINSAAFATASKMNSINQSVVYLGLNTVKNMALSFAAVGVLPRTNHAGFDVQKYLLHSLSVASIARALAQKFASGETDPGDCYIAGLLHDFGKVVFAQFMPDEFRTALEHCKTNAVPLHEAEAAVIGADHTVVGSMLAERWQFPLPLVECIRNHHRAEGQNAMGDCLRMADQICRFRMYGDAGNPYRPDEVPIAPQRFGTDIAMVIDKLGDIDMLIAEAHLFAQVEAE
ncbi:MAG TPA: HDOD domain-containing protein [Rhodocyclaceae bacterium]|nr:HDOD domain-containing protein [Rhodocyclaceae bacterium]